MLISVYTSSGKFLGADFIDSSDIEGIVNFHIENGNIVVFYPDDVKVEEIEVSNE